MKRTFALLGISVFGFFLVPQFGLSKLWATPSHFMGSSLVFLPTTEDIGKNNLVFRFNHRFGNAKSGFQNFYGLDEGANTQLALDWGLTDRWMVGIARTSEKKIWELRSKFKIIEQENFPFTVSLFGVFGQGTEKQEILFNNFNRSWTSSPALDAQINTRLNEYELTTKDKQSYLASVLISRRWTEWFSLQVSPLYSYQNFTTYNIHNDRTGLQVGGRFKLSKRIDLTFDSLFTPKRDYFGDSYQTEAQRTTIPGTNQFSSEEINSGLANRSLSLNDVFLRNIILDQPVKHYFVPVALGLDIETGGHVFQVFVSNSRALAHTQILRGAEYDFFKKEFNLGFNILRQFSFASDKAEW